MPGFRCCLYRCPSWILALPIVIAVEAFLCRRWLEVPWKRAWLGAGVANAISTLAGFPILWIAWVVVLISARGDGVPKLAEPWCSIYAVTVQAAWLLPDEDRLYWMIPTAGMVLLIPAFFVTVLIEKWVYRRTFRESQRAAFVTNATWRMHFITYGLLLFAGLCLLVSSLATHRGGPGGAADRRPPLRPETSPTAAAVGSPADLVAIGKERTDEIR